MNKVPCPQCGKLFNQNEPWKRICVSCYIVNKKPQSKHGANLFVDNNLLKRLIMLCHPDKHGGSQMSVEVTQKLLEMRNK
jgi:hypothetical protein